MFSFTPVRQSMPYFSSQASNLPKGGLWRKIMAASLYSSSERFTFSNRCTRSTISLHMP